MATIKKQLSKDNVLTFKVRYRTNGQSCSSTFGTSREAEEFVDRIERMGAVAARKSIDLPGEPRVIASGATVNECVDFYIDHRDVTRESRAYYRQWLRVHISPELGDMRINELTREDIVDWIDRANDGKRSGRTIARNFKLLHAALKGAESRGEIKSNPAFPVPRLPRTIRKKKVVFLTRGEYALFYKAMPKHYQVLVEFLVNSGLRIGEAMALTPADVNLDLGTVTVDKSWGYTSLDNVGHRTAPPKSLASERTVDVPRNVLDKLDLGGEFIFTNTRGGRVTEGALRLGAWATANRLSGLAPKRQPRIHDLRHTHASWLLDAGVSFAAVAERLGHSSVRTTADLYTHVNADSTGRILAALDQMTTPEA